MSETGLISVGTPAFSNLLISQGIFAVLFVVLLFYVMREAAKREAHLMAFLDRVAVKIETICADVSEIRRDVDALKGR